MDYWSNKAVRACIGFLAPHSLSHTFSHMRVASARTSGTVKHVSFKDRGRCTMSLLPLNHVWQSGGRAFSQGALNAQLYKSLLRRAMLPAAL